LPACFSPSLPYKLVFRTLQKERKGTTTMSSQNGFEAQHQQENPGEEHTFDRNCETIPEVGWYILGEDQQHVGPYALSELRVLPVSNSTVSGHVSISIMLNWYSELLKHLLSLFTSPGQSIL
ncbi:hypothetical protein F2P56_018700, partial [Juglans regia]